MIVFVVGEAHQYTVRQTLDVCDHPFHGGMILLGYQEFLSFRRLPLGDYVFLDLERLTPCMLANVSRRARAAAIAMPGRRMLNRPVPSLTREAVMDRLYRSGINDFRVLSGAARTAPLNYPVFLRRQDDHGGPLTSLLPDEGALHGAITRLAAEGHAPRDLLVTEYVDARNAEGLHEKRSYFRIGDRLFPVSLDASRHWVCKGEYDDPHAADRTEAERAFIAGAEDEADLRRVFDAAGISYGRADYARLASGRIAVFEINTNPNLDPPHRVPAEARTYGILLIQRWIAALAAFSPPDPPGTRPVWVEVGERHPLGRPPGLRLRHRFLHGFLSLTGQLHRESELRRALHPRLAARADAALARSDQGERPVKGRLSLRKAS